MAAADASRLIWEYRGVSAIDSDAGQKLLREALHQGWEPFAVHYSSLSGTKIHLRRQIVVPVE